MEIPEKEKVIWQQVFLLYMEMVKKFDYENYLGLLLLPGEARRAVTAVRAYNVELAQIRDTVSDKTIGLMRIQFWKEAIERIYKEQPPMTPIAQELYAAYKTVGLSRLWLSRMNEAREESMNDRQFKTINEFDEILLEMNERLF